MTNDDKRHQDNLDKQTRSEIGRKGGQARAAQTDMSNLGQDGGHASGGQNQNTTSDFDDRLDDDM